MENYSNMEIYLAMQANAIKQKNRDIQQYKSRPNSNKIYIDRETEYLSKLIESHNGIEKEYLKLQSFECPSHQVTKLIDNDPELGLIIVRLYIRPDKSNIGHITYNPYGND